MTFGEKLHTALANARTKAGGILTKEEWIKVADLVYDKAPPKRKKSVTTTDEEGLTALESEPSLQGVAIRVELAKAQFWCKNNARKCTRRMFVKWLGNAERVVTNAGGTSVVKQDIYVEPQGWKTSTRAPARLNVSDESWELIVERGWFNLAADMRRDILRSL